ncbi:DNA repair and recombination protein [Wickerhamomyces ciferrii]|uniref:DNA helicase n=1 Tax=Wickerhamomyces ciferrii (strain ATCC 14091 / BCRC 22168 / CBS 111 / JCM 3599 / NBRC 0793 / NRRL Y-1031 F-60-10) TaxID=1206466 RepID=K0KJP5_WICCF|nr:DNA repair and recombination protein [Wickerhamomyces ciferrii]CCH42357.1 DNA repair and recombination protein [Wickerhamomyces ciferrii]
MYRRQRSNGGASAPFRPPRINIPSVSNSNKNTVERTNNEASKENIDPIETKAEERQVKPVPNVVPTRSSGFKPMVPKRTLVAGGSGNNIGEHAKRAQKDAIPGHERFFEIVWRKQTMKKNKTWDGDGFIILTSNFISLRADDSLNYKELNKQSNISKFTTDGVFSMGSYEVEVSSEITNDHEIEKLKFDAKLGKLGGAGSSQVPTPIMVKQEAKSIPISIKREPKPPIINKQFKQVVPTDPKPMKGEPLYDPSLEGAIIMTKASSNDTDVVIDPFLGKKLRPHQVQGVKFLYECLMDLRGFDGQGALLADDMGLGKTLMTITTLWTLLKQSPKGFETPVVNKVLIACPVTLIGNWKREFKKWLPMNRLNVLTLSSKNTTSKDKQDVKNFARTKVYQVLIMGYEKILNMKDELKLSKFDLLICDEGHRLKNNSNKTLQVLNSLEISKKILLSGTPIQNDLSEFFNIIDFINPGILGNFNQFKRNFMNPILKSRETNCINPEIKSKGNEKSQELIDITKPFILRRTSAIMSNHLPPRTDIVLFCRPTNLQINLFNEVLGSTNFDNMISKTTASGSLSLITMFKKICNSPSLIINDKTFNQISDVKISNQITSGKIQVLIELLNEISSKTNEKVILVSNYTQTLDILQNILLKLNLTYQRLDGSTPNKDRDSIVNTFNTTSSISNFAFLLSSKSGGVGLNLIGASRLILFDNDWNPAIDLQAMARIHRDGQKKPVFIYRLVTTGCIDEKILQRQLMKNNLSDKFLDNQKNSKDDLFDSIDLKDLFTLNLSTNSNTHDLMRCDCEGKGIDITIDESDEEEEEDEEAEPEKATKSNSWVSALEVKNNSTDENMEKSKNIKKCLIDYRHIDPKLIKTNEDIDIGDLITESIVNKTSDLVSFILTKVNKTSL